MTSIPKRSNAYVWKRSREVKPVFADWQWFSKFSDVAAGLFDVAAMWEQSKMQPKKRKWAQLAFLLTGTKIMDDWLLGGICHKYSLL